MVQGVYGSNGKDHCPGPGQEGAAGRLKARYLTYFFLGALESFVSAMVLENQPLRGPGQKDRIERGLMEVFMNGARSESRR